MTDICFILLLSFVIVYAVLILQIAKNVKGKVGFSFDDIHFHAIINLDIPMIL